MGAEEPISSDAEPHAVRSERPALPSDGLPLPDCRGACYPQPAGSSADLAASLWAQRQQQRALALTEAWAGRLSGWWGRYLEVLQRLLVDMPPVVAVAAFRPAVVGLALSRQSDDNEGLVHLLALESR